MDQSSASASSRRSRGFTSSLGHLLAAMDASDHSNSSRRSSRSSTIKSQSKSALSSGNLRRSRSLVEPKPSSSSRGRLSSSSRIGFSSRAEESMLPVGHRQNAMWTSSSAKGKAKPTLASSRPTLARGLSNRDMVTLLNAGDPKRGNVLQAIKEHQSPMKPSLAKGAVKRGSSNQAIRKSFVTGSRIRRFQVGQQQQPKLSTNHSSIVVPGA